MNFVVQTRRFVLKTRRFALKTRKSVFKMMNLAGCVSLASGAFLRYFYAFVVFLCCFCGAFMVLLYCFYGVLC